MNRNYNIGYDETKKMLNALRNFKVSKTKRLNEEKNDFTVINNVETNINTSDDLDLKISEEDKNVLSQTIDNFKTQVTQNVGFSPGFTINDGQIRLDAKIATPELNFVLIAGEDSGLYINTEMMKIETDVIDILGKLNTFKESFITSLNTVIDNRNNNITNKENI